VTCSPSAFSRRQQQYRSTRESPIPPISRPPPRRASLISFPSCVHLPPSRTRSRSRSSSLALGDARSHTYSISWIVAALAERHRLRARRALVLSADHSLAPTRLATACSHNLYRLEGTLLTVDTVLDPSLRARRRRTASPSPSTTSPRLRLLQLV
jgi:hypothetical protein